MDLYHKMKEVLAAVGRIEHARTEEEAIVEAMTSFEKLEYPHVMISFLQYIDGERYLIADPLLSTGKRWKTAAPYTKRRFDGGTDLLPRVLQRRKARYVADSQNDPEGENDAELAKQIGLVTQYAMPLATDSSLIGTLQVDMGEVDCEPTEELRVLDALSAHLSIAIERRRALDSLYYLQTKLLNQAKLTAFDAAAAYILHGLKKELSAYELKLDAILRNPAVRSNKDALEFLNDTKRNISNWILSVRSSTSSVKANERLDYFNPEDIVKDSVSSWYDFARGRSCEIRYTSDAKNCLIYCRKTDLHETLSCLITNAIDAHARSIVISLTVAVRPNLDETPKRHVEVVVADDGDGVPPELAKDVGTFGFTTKIKAGHGMGLAIVGMLSARMGGGYALRASGRSAQQPRTEFIVWIPVAKSEKSNDGK
jgi:signal transduction histidine kinase